MQIQRNLFARTEPESQNYCNKYNGIFIERKKTKTEIVFANFEQLAENEITTAETTAMAIAFRRAHQGRYLRAILYLCTTRFEWKRLKFDEWSDLQRTANTNRELGSQIPDFRPCLLLFYPFGVSWAASVGYISNQYAEHDALWCGRSAVSYKTHYVVTVRNTYFLCIRSLYCHVLIEKSEPVCSIVVILCGEFRSREDSRLVFVSWSRKMASGDSNKLRLKWLLAADVRSIIAAAFICKREAPKWYMQSGDEK